MIGSLTASFTYFNIIYIKQHTKICNSNSEMQQTSGRKEPVEEGTLPSLMSHVAMAAALTSYRPAVFFPQIPAGGSWSGSRWHPRGVRGHGARWGTHRPHPALWYAPIPGPVAQPALQTRRDQRAPHRAIAAEGTQTGEKK